MQVARKFLLFSFFSFLVFGFAYQARAESAGTLQSVPNNYALVGFGYGSDDKACTLYWKEGRLNIDGTVGEVDANWWQQPCTDAGGGGNRYGDDGIPSSNRQKQAPANQYLTGWTWDSNTSGGKKLNNGYDDSNPDNECFFQMYQQFDPITKQMIGPVQGFGASYDGTCSERGYTLNVLQKYTQASTGKVIVAVGLSLGNDGDVNYVTISSRALPPPTLQTISGKVYNKNTGVGFAGTSIFTCSSAGSVTTKADGTFSFQLLTGTAYCVRNDSDPYPGYTGPILAADYNVDNSDPSTYLGQFAGYDNGGHDRNTDSGFDFKYTPGGGTPTPPPSPLTVSLKIRQGTTGAWVTSLSGNPPIDGVSLQSTVSNSTGGNITFYLYCNRADTGVNVTPGYDASKVQTPSSWTKTWTDGTNRCSYTTPGTYKAKVIAQNGAQSAQDQATVTIGTPLTLGATLTAAPNSGTTPVNSVLTADATGTQTGTINYNFWYDCTSGTDYGTTSTACGALTAPAPGSCIETLNVGYKCDTINTHPKSIPAHSYSTGSSTTIYNPKVVIQRGTSPDAQASATVTVDAPTLSVVLVPSPSPGGNSPLTVDLTATVSGTALGTINYSYWWDCAYADVTPTYPEALAACSDPDGTTGNIYGTKWDNINTNPKTVTHIYNVAGVYRPIVLVERSTAAPALGVTSLTVTNGAPVVTIGPTDQFFCQFSGKDATIHWTYTDDNSAISTSYQIKVYQGAVLVKTYDGNDGAIVFTIPPGDIAYGTTYTATVQAWDAQGKPSNIATTPAFSTLAHDKPHPDFTWTTPVKVDKLEQFTDATSYGTSLSPYTYSWDFGCPAGGCTPGTSTLQNPTTTFSQPGNYTVSLSVQDTGNGPLVCSTPHTVSVGNSFIPSWKEIAPF